MHFSASFLRSFWRVSLSALTATSLLAATGIVGCSTVAGDRDGSASETLADAKKDGGVEASPGAEAGVEAGASAGDGGAPATGALRIVAGNLTSGNLQSYDPGPGTRIFQALKPDVALVQEFNYGTNDDASIRTFVDEAFGTDYGYAREPGVQIPNGVVSRYPILQSGVWSDTQVTNRSFTWAHIDIPGPHDLWAVSVHLLTSSSTKRAAQATEIVGYLKSNVPSDDYVTVGGDFNSSDANLIGIFQPFVDPSAAFPDDQNGNTATNSGRRAHYDWVLVSAELEAFQVPSRVGSVVRPHGLVFDTRVFSPITDAAPALSSDSAAPSMQHMAVVKDFVIQ